jgi:hypothetical protein
MCQYLLSVLIDFVMPSSDQTSHSYAPVKNSSSRITRCDHCIHYKHRKCSLGYHVQSNSKPCRQGTTRGISDLFTGSCLKADIVSYYPNGVGGWGNECGRDYKRAV